MRWHYQFQLANESMGAGNSCRNHPAPKDRAPIATARPGLRVVVEIIHGLRPFYLASPNQHHRIKRC